MSAWRLDVKHLTSWEHSSASTATTLSYHSSLAQVTAHAMARLWATRALHGALDWVVGRPLYLVDFHCFAIPQRRAPPPPGSHQSCIAPETQRSLLTCSHHSQAVQAPCILAEHSAGSARRSGCQPGMKAWVADDAGAMRAG